MERIGKILDSLVDTLGLKKKINEEKVMALWEKAVNRRVAERTRPIKIQGSKLLVEVSGSSWRNELIFLKPELIRKLNSMVGRVVIDDIIFVAGAGPDSQG
ncbi:DUF721 domain-containing protein [candidate division TA06 bacterium]|uniref:DUF721 domain-containing protein n=1 Tax=candidate division TA06 bacterium TaxID=2250710 RepID=A0A523UNL8_UNCT6|nr:MAG: DUF721 domain-containing protein [candidate division TA06 bacterium]